MTATRRPKRPRASECDKELAHEGDGFARKKKGKGEDNAKGKDHLTEPCGSEGSLQRHKAEVYPGAQAEKAAARQKAIAEGTFKCFFEGCGASCGSYYFLQQHKAEVHPAAQAEKAAARKKAITEDFQIFC